MPFCARPLGSLAFPLGQASITHHKVIQHSLRGTPLLSEPHLLKRRKTKSSKPSRIGTPNLNALGTPGCGLTYNLGLKHLFKPLGFLVHNPSGLVSPNVQNPFIHEVTLAGKANGTEQLVTYKLSPDSTGWKIWIKVHHQGPNNPNASSPLMAIRCLYEAVFG